jgi:hypothetical protein
LDELLSRSTVHSGRRTSDVVEVGAPKCVLDGLLVEVLNPGELLDEKVAVVDRFGFVLDQCRRRLAHASADGHLSPELFVEPARRLETNEGTLADNLGPRNVLFGQFFAFVHELVDLVELALLHRNTDSHGIVWIGHG